MKNLRTTEEFRLLGTTTTKMNQHKCVYFIPSPGNWGDALINAGTVQFLDFIGCDFEQRSRAELLNKISHLDGDKTLDALIVVGGGGGWCETCFSTRDFVASIAPRVMSVLVLPTTYVLDREPGTAANVVYFSRDLHLSLNNVPEARFCHDMAFFLEEDIQPEEHTLQRLVALRMDRERSPLAKDFEFAVDLSLLGDAYSSVEPLLRIVSHFENVVSDRLHIAIAACLLNKGVTLLPGSYNKSEQVFAASIAEHFPGQDSRYGRISNSGPHPRTRIPFAHKWAAVLTSPIRRRKPLPEPTGHSALKQNQGGEYPTPFRSPRGS